MQTSAHDGATADLQLCAFGLMQGDGVLLTLAIGEFLVRKRLHAKRTYCFAIKYVAMLAAAGVLEGHIAPQQQDLGVSVCP